VDDRFCPTGLSKSLLVTVTRDWTVTVLWPTAGEWPCIFRSTKLHSDCLPRDATRPTEWHNGAISKPIVAVSERKSVSGAKKTAAVRSVIYIAFVLPDTLIVLGSQVQVRRFSQTLGCQVCRTVLQHCQSDVHGWVEVLSCRNMNGNSFFIRGKDSNASSHN
jgi:hypothetical protein